MSHHGSQIPNEANAILANSIFSSNNSTFPEVLGKTNKFPDGKLNSSDEGEITFGVGAENGKVVMNFGDKPIAWVGMTPHQAKEIAASLIQKAELIESQSACISK